MHCDTNDVLRVATGTQPIVQFISEQQIGHLGIAVSGPGIVILLTQKVVLHEICRKVLVANAGVIDDAPVHSDIRQ